MKQIKKSVKKANLLELLLKLTTSYGLLNAISVVYYY